MCTSNAQLKHLNLKNCPKLKHLDALQTLVDEYDLSKNSELRYVAVGLGRPLRTLSLPTNNKIDTLMVPAAGLKAIDLSQTKTTEAVRNRQQLRAFSTRPNGNDTT